MNLELLNIYIQTYNGKEYIKVVEVRSQFPLNKLSNEIYTRGEFPKFSPINKNNDNQLRHYGKTPFP